MIKIILVSLLCGLIAGFFFLMYIQALYRRDREADRVMRIQEMRRQERVGKLKVMLDKIEHPENYPDEEGEDGEDGEEGEDKEDSSDDGKVA